MKGWKDKVKEVASQVAQGAKDVTETAQTKIEIASLNSKIADEKRSFGLNIYDMFVAGKSYEEMHALFVAAEEKIASLKAKIASEEEKSKR